MITRNVVGGMIAATLAIGIRPAAAELGKIEWNAPQDISGDADVCTNGTPLYAYCGAPTGSDALRVNGVAFTPDVRLYRALGDDILYDRFTFGESDARDLTEGIAVTDTFTTNYWLMLSRSAMAAKKDVPLLTVTLKNLTPGRRYLVQLWCGGTRNSDFLGQTMTFDGTVAVNQHSGEAGRMGQFITGEFTPLSDTQTFTAAPSKYALISAIQVRDLSPVNVISWEAGDISADGDVRTEGQLCYAYAQNGAGATVNGVKFTGVSSHGAVPASSWRAELNQSGLSYHNTSAFAENFTPNAEMTAAYGGILAGGAYGSTGAGPRAGTLTLRNLIPGRAYLVQIWVNDCRTTGSPRYVRLDGACDVRYRKGTYGQYAVGRFRAITRDQAISLAANADSGNACLQWNAIQVRDVSSGISWGEVTPIADATCVSTEGSSAYAYSYAAGSVSVNGVTFAPGGTSGAGMGGDITFTSIQHVNTSEDFMAGAVAAGLSQELHDILQRGVYSSSVRSARMTLRNLEPGARYQVQLLVGDRRASIVPRDMAVGGVPRLHFADTNSYPFGTSVKGEFTAVADTQEIPLLAMATETAGKNRLTCQIQAVQLRKLSSPAIDIGPSWSATPVSSGTDVYTAGTLLYAYGFNAVTVNGVPFAASTSTSALGTDVTLTGFSSKSTTAFVPSGATLTGLGDYGTLLKGGIYRSTSEATITLKNLTRGHKYAVQIWITDARTTGAGLVRYAVVDEAVTLPFHGDGGLGTYALGTFVATEATHVIAMSFGVESGTAVSSQLNALQVRDLGEVEGEIVSGTADISGTALVKSGTDTMTLGDAPNLTHILLNGGTLALGDPERFVQPLHIAIANGATLQLPGGKSLTLAALTGAGTVEVDAGGATLVFTNAVDGVFAGTLSGDVSLVKTDAWPSGFGGDISGAFSLTVHKGLFRLFAGDRSGPFNLTVERGATVELDFLGTCDVASAILGRRHARGYVAATTYPDFISGPGALIAPTIGTAISIR